MAHVFVPALGADGLSPFQASEVVLRQFKARLHKRFPEVGSSHLSEALSAAYGFNTHAAMRAEMAKPLAWPLGKPFDASRFRSRLLELGYPVGPDFQFGPPPPPLGPPAKYLEMLQQLKELDAGRDVERRLNLQAQCARAFAQAFDLGHPENRDDRSVTVRWRAGVDHRHCLPDWGDIVNSRTGGGIDFPGSDHRRFFFQTLPLGEGKFAEYQTAMVSMPYASDDAQPRLLAEAAHFAGRLGWTCSVHPEWSWYAPGATTLVLFRRAGSHESLLQDWQGSFKQWIVANRAALKKKAGDTRRKVIDDLVECPHVPLDLQDFEDCRERYLKEFAAHLYYSPKDGMALVMERLMATWAQERSQSGR